jgi:hypothetical protein
MSIVHGMQTTPTEPSDVSDGTVPLEPERAWDLPAGPRNGHAAALRVPCSEGPASMLLEPEETSLDDLIAAEPALEPMRFMEVGVTWTPEALAVVHALDRPIHPDDDDPFVQSVFHGNAGH